VVVISNSPYDIRVEERNGAEGQNARTSRLYSPSGDVRQWPLQAATGFPCAFRFSLISSLTKRKCSRNASISDAVSRAKSGERVGFDFAGCFTVSAYHTPSSGSKPFGSRGGCSDVKGLRRGHGARSAAGAGVRAFPWLILVDLADPAESSQSRR
jgi:hypothetical protein